jgi:hypothetical protein
MDARDRTAGGRTWVWWRRSVSRRGLAGDEGTSHGEALGAWGIARARSVRSAELDHGRKTGTGAPEDAYSGGKVPRRRNYLR